MTDRPYSKSFIEKFASFFHTLAVIWFVAVGVLVFIGFLAMWWDEGFWAAASTFAPWNFVNMIFTLISLSPGLLFLWLAYLVDPTRGQNSDGW